MVSGAPGRARGRIRTSASPVDHAGQESFLVCVAPGPYALETLAAAVDGFSGARFFSHMVPIRAVCFRWRYCDHV